MKVALSNPVHRTLLLFASILAASTTAAAKTITVQAAGNYQTIQSGIDAAGAMDTVLVKAGVYREQVVIPADRTGLVLKAKGKVILNAWPAGSVGGGPAMSIAAADVMVRGLVIQNARAEREPNDLRGYGIECVAPGLVLEKVMIRNVHDRAVFISNGTGTRIVHCEFNYRGVEVTGDEVSVIGCEMNSSYLEINGNGANVVKCAFWDAGLEINGDDASLNKNRVIGVYGTAIAVDGRNARIQKNVVDGCYGSGIYVRNGDGTRIEKNQVSNASDSGISAGGSDLLVRSNEISQAFWDYGIHTSGLNPTVVKNRIRNCLGTWGALDISNAATGGLIEGNLLDRNGGSNVEIGSRCHNLVIRDNVVRRALDGYEGFEIEGSGHILVGNVADRGTYHGFEIDGDAITLENNRSLNNGGDGFFIEGGAGVVLRRNKALGNAGEGIENNGTNSMIDQNTATANHADFADAGTLASFANNKSSDGTSVTPATPEVD